MLTARTAHLISLGAAIIVIVVAGWQQWFFGDDWALLAPRLDGDLLAPHVGHLTIIPAIAFAALRDTVGLHSYAPFLALAVVMHLTIAHLLWRLLGRVGVTPWLATGLAAIVAVLGAGAENILWAFQFGFLGAIAAGLAILLQLQADRPAWWAIAILSLVAIGFSGTALPMLAAAGLVTLLRHRWWHLAWFAPAGVAYLTWYLVVARESPSGIPPVSGLDDLPLAVVFAAAMIAGGLGRALPWIGLGVIPAVAVAAWAVVTVRQGWRTPALTAYAMIGGAVVFVSLTAWSRSSLGLSGAASQRYAYLVIVLLLPALGLLLTAALVRWRAARVIVAVVVSAAVVGNAVLLVSEGAVQAEREQASRLAIEASIAALRADPDDIGLLDRAADPVWAPDLTGRDLLQLVDRGQWPTPSQSPGP